MIIVSAPSGAGKSTIVRHLLETFPQLGFSVSATSRMKRATETDGREYYFVSTERFEQMIENLELLEWQEVYPGSYYGTPVSEVERMASIGQFPVFDVDVVGGLNIKKIFGNTAISIFIKPPSYQVLASRLRSRATDSEESLRKRLDKAKWELTFEKDFDAVLVNDILQDTYVRAEKLVKEFLKIG